MKNIVNVICNGVGVAMGIGVVVLNILNELQVKDSILMLGIGLFCVSISLLSRNK